MPNRTLTVAVVVVAALALAPTAAAATNGRIAFQALDGRFPQVFTIEPDGSGLRQVTRVPAKDPETDPGGENPSWSPDGTTIAFDTGNATGVNLWTVRPDGTALSEFPLGVGAFNGDPAYSPDGTQISFDQDTGPKAPKVHGIFVAGADGSGARRLTTAPRTAEAHDTESQWSPDGTRIAFTRVKRIGRAAILVIAADGHGLKRLTPWKLDAASPDWSPDGKAIIFNSHFDAGPKQSANLYSMRPDGSGRTPLTHHHGGRTHSFRPSWSPDGNRIVFARFRARGKNARTDLYTANPDGTGLARITNLPKRFPMHPDWGPAPSPPVETSPVDTTSRAFAPGSARRRSWRCCYSTDASVSANAPAATAKDEREEYMQRLAARPLTSGIAVVKSDGAGAFAARPERASAEVV
jgi:TolB protein